MLARASAPGMRERPHTAMASVGARRSRLAALAVVLVLSLAWRWLDSGYRMKA